MLAEPRRKVRIGPNPRGKFFTEDDDNRGRQMLLKMGWKTGDGLGANLHGMSEPIKPKVNTESRGLGFDRKQDPWVAHNEEFEQLLKNLNSNSSDGDGPQGSNDAAKGNGSSKKDELEIKSKGSRSRIHYHKFVKNKDLSKASYKDMSCIFGKTLDVTVQLVPTSVVDSVVEPIQESKLNEGDSQMATDTSEDIIEPTTPEESVEESKSKKKKRKKNRERGEDSPSLAEEESIQPEPESMMEEPENMEKKKKKKKSKESKEASPVPTTEEECIQVVAPVEAEEENMERKKKKKKRKEDSPSPAEEETIQPEPDKVTEVVENVERKKKKKRKQKDQQEEELDNGNISSNNNTEELLPESINGETGMVPENSSETISDIKKKKKKSKKRKRDDEVEEGQDEIHQNIPETIQAEIEPEPSPENTDSGEPETKKKKKKKSKKARHEESTDEVENDTSVISPEANLADPIDAPLQEAEPNKDPVPQENAEKLGSMQFINRGSLVDYFRNKRLQMLNRASANT